MPVKRGQGTWDVPVVEAGAAVFTAGIAAAAQIGRTAHAATLAVPAPAVGVQFHGTWSDYTDAQRLQVLDELHAAGVSWVRIDLGWASLQESSSSAYAGWYVALADSVVDAARARGMNVLMTLWATPKWAGAATSTAPDPAAYAKAATWVAAHFKGRVAAWEVWNEPNLTDFYSGTPTQYAALLKAAYPAFKAGDPNAPVVLGGPSYNDVDWLSKVYAAGAQGSFDVM